MRKVFLGYYRPNENELKSLWSDCIFIFDTNVLLDLHRYSKITCDEFLSVLEKISERVWIPHQVGLEYQENRLSVIAEQESRYDKAGKVLDNTLSGLEAGLAQLGLKKSHSPIDPRPTLEKIKSTLEGFRSELKELGKDQLEVSDEDGIRNQLDVIFDGRVGEAPASQDELEKIYQDGKIRYENKIPPGYKDQSKGKSAQQDGEKKNDSFFHNGLLYKREFGDLIIWNQLLDHLAKQNYGHVILITSDNKEDWWWKFNGKVIGPRHELVEEIRSKTQVNLFYMYNAEQFLTFAREYLAAEVSQESIDQVREVMQQRLPNRFLEVVTKSHQVTEYFYNFLREVTPEDDIVYQDVGFPDLIQTNSRTGYRRGFKIKLLSRVGTIRIFLKDFIDRAAGAIKQREIDEVTLILVSESEEQIMRARSIFDERYRPQIIEPIYVLYKIARFDDNNHLLEFQM